MMRRQLFQLDNDARTPDTLIFAAQSTTAGLGV